MNPTQHAHMVSLVRYVVFQRRHRIHNRPLNRLCRACCGCLAWVFHPLREDLDEFTRAIFPVTPCEPA
jgi:hypothetical protein